MGGTNATHLLTKEAHSFFIFLFLAVEKVSLPLVGKLTNFSVI